MFYKHKLDLDVSSALIKIKIAIWMDVASNGISASSRPARNITIPCLWTRQKNRKHICRAKGERFTLPDVRDTAEYHKAHLPGAVLISDMNEQADRVLNRNLPVVTYSEDYNCHASTFAAQKLEKMVFTTFENKGSYQDWVDHSYPLEV